MILFIFLSKINQYIILLYLFQLLYSFFSDILTHRFSERATSFISKYQLRAKIFSQEFQKIESELQGFTQTYKDLSRLNELSIILRYYYHILLLPHIITTFILKTI